MNRDAVTKSLYGLNITMKQGIERENLENLKKALILINAIGVMATKRGSTLCEEAKEQGLTPKVHWTLDNGITFFTNFSYDSETRKSNPTLELLENRDGKRQIVHNVTPEYLIAKILPYLDEKTIESYGERMKQHIERVNDSVDEHDRVSIYAQSKGQKQMAMAR